MIPTGFSYIKENTPVSLYPNKSYKIDWENKRVAGTVDGLKAVEQSAILATNIERYQYDILPDYYGIELNDLYGQDMEYVKAILEYRIKDALSIDERILDLQNYEAEVRGNDLIITFDLYTTLGEIENITQKYSDLVVS